jgi:hypothetical protein
MEKFYLEFSDDLKRYLHENNYNVVSVLRSSGYSVTTTRTDTNGEVAVIDLGMVVTSASVSGVITDIFKDLWKRFKTLFGSSRKIVFIDKEKGRTIIDEYGEINVDAIHEAKDRNVHIKIKEIE